MAACSASAASACFLRFSLRTAARWSCSAVGAEEGESTPIWSAGSSAPRAASIFFMLSYRLCLSVSSAVVSCLSSAILPSSCSLEDAFCNLWLVEREVVEPPAPARIEPRLTVVEAALFPAMLLKNLLISFCVFTCCVVK